MRILSTIDRYTLAEDNGTYMPKKQKQEYSRERLKYYQKIYGKKITLRFIKLVDKIMDENDDVLKKLAEL